MLTTILYITVGLLWAIICVAKNYRRGVTDNVKNGICFVSNLLLWPITIPIAVYCKFVLNRDTLFND